MREARDFDAEAPSVKQARRFAAEALADLAPGTADVALLILSELATNCVRHARTPYRIAIERRGEVLRVEVEDGSAEPPVLRNPEPDDPTGRGLQIVDSLSESWGVDRRHGSGTVVWFALPVGDGS